ncbi:MAG: beta-lactamase family protein [Chloroflexota bacterium]|nr:beta-lactamase family protein [Chloroflexota bacterium]
MRPEAACLSRAVVVAEEAVATGGYPSAVLGIANGEREIWTHVEPGTTGARVNTIFPVASLAKPMIATIVLRLVEHGQVLLSSPVAAHVPEFGVDGKDRVTIGQLLTHTGGIDDGGRWLELLTAGATHGAFLAAACESKLAFVPGTRCAYSSLGFVVVAELVSRIIGRAYQDELTAQVFGPLGMPETGFRPADSARAARVHPILGAAVDESAEFSSVESLTASGAGLWSTIGDLFTFGRTWLRQRSPVGNRLLRPVTVALMTECHTLGLIDGSDGGNAGARRGLGWEVLVRERLIGPGASSFGHRGATGTLLWIDPENDLVFVFLSNRWGADDQFPARALNAAYRCLKV